MREEILVCAKLHLTSSNKLDRGCRGKHVLWYLYKGGAMWSIGLRSTHVGKVRTAVGKEEFKVGRRERKDSQQAS